MKCFGIICLINLHQLEGGSTDPGSSQLCFDYHEKKSNWLKQPIFYLGYVLPSNVVFKSYGAHFVNLDLYMKL